MTASSSLSVRTLTLPAHFALDPCKKLILVVSTMHKTPKLKTPEAQKRPAVLTRIHAAVEGEPAGFMLHASSHMTRDDGCGAADRCLEACSIISQPVAADTSTVGRRCAASGSTPHTFELGAAAPGG